MLHIAATRYIVLLVVSSSNVYPHSNMALRYFDYLPTELQLGIFELLYIHHGPSALLEPILTCERWYSLCKPLLWENIRIRNKNLVAILCCIDCVDQETCNLILNITLHMEPLSTMLLEKTFPELGPHPLINVMDVEALEERRGFVCIVGETDQQYGLEWAWETKYIGFILLKLARLAALIQRKLCSMHTFSFLCDYRAKYDRKEWTAGYGYWYSLWIPVSITKTFVRALPPTCVNLELDCRHSEDHAMREPERHLCGALQEVLPRMQHVRLCKFGVCPSLFDSVDDDGQPTVYRYLKSLSGSSYSVSIRYDPRKRLCRPSERNQHLSYQDIWVHGWLGNNLRCEINRQIHTAQARHLQSMYLKVQFPDLVHLTTCRKLSRRTNSKPYLHMIDVLAESSTIFPLADISMYSSGVGLEEASWKNTIGGHAFRPRGYEGPHLHGWYSEVMRSLDSAWITSKFGMRYPEAYRSKLRLDWAERYDGVVDLVKLLRNLEDLRARGEVRLELMDQYTRRIDAALLLTLNCKVYAGFEARLEDDGVE